MTAVGANFVVAHMGLTTDGNIGTQSVLALGDCPALIDGMASAARAVNPNVIVLRYGGGQILCCANAKIVWVVLVHARWSDCPANRRWLPERKHSQRSEENHDWKVYDVGGHASGSARLRATALDEQSACGGCKATDCY